MDFPTGTTNDETYTVYAYATSHLMSEESYSKRQEKKRSTTGRVTLNIGLPLVTSV